MMLLGDSHPLGQGVAAQSPGEHIPCFSLSQCSLLKIQGSNTAFWFAEDDAIPEPNGAKSDQEQGGKAPFFENHIGD